MPDGGTYAWQDLQEHAKLGWKILSILWAPKTTAAGRSVRHWTTMTEVAAGDVVFHYARRQIRSLGRAQTPASTAARPYTLPDTWEADGWAIQVSYADLTQPIGRDEIPAPWRRDRIKAPFDRNGDVNQGYLFPVSERSRPHCSKASPTAGHRCHPPGQRPPCQPLETLSPG